MSDKPMGRGHRIVHKTQFMLDHDKNVKESDDRREDRKRKKHVREQEVELELEDEAEGFFMSLAKKASKSSSKTSSTQPSTTNLKSKTASSSRSKEATQSSDKDDERERHREKLIRMLVIRDEISREELDSLSLPLIQKIWDMGERAGAKSPTKAPAKTPAKKVLARTSNIQLLGSPLDALNAAKGKPDDTPVASRRKRRNSSSDLDDLDDIVKRPRVGEDSAKRKPSGLKPFKSSNPPSLPPSRSNSRAPSIQSKYGGSTPASRASSAAPAMVSVGSSSARAGSSKHTASAGGLQDIDEEMIELSDDEDEVKIVPKGKKRGTALERVGKGKSNKPKCSDYFGMARKLIDETFYRVLAHLGHHGMFPDDQREYDRLIRKSWLVVVKELGENPEKYPMEDEHETLVKVRIDSFRGRARVKIEPAIKKIYGLTGKPDKVIARVEKLQAGEFHKDPEVKGRAGNYQHPYLEECVREVFFIGRRPVGVLFPELYDPVPIPALAYVCAVIGFCISLYSTGVFVDARAESAMVAKFYKDHLPNLELFQECRPTKCEKYRALLYTESMKQAGKSAKVPKEERTGPGVLTATDFEDEDEDEEEGGDRSEADEKPRKAAPPVKSRPCAQKKPSRDVDEDEDEGKINSEAEEKPKKAAPPVKARSRAHKKPLWDEDEDEGENGSEADEQPKKVAPLVKSRPSAHKNSSRDEDKDEGESENGSEADEKQKKAAPLAKPRPRPRQKFPRDKDEDEGEEGSETDETPKKVASPAKACSSTHQKPASKLKPSSSESSDLSSESGSSSSDNGEDAGGGKRNADRDVARPEHGSTSSRAVNAATDDLEDAGVGGMDVDQDHDSQPPLPDKQAGGTVANVDNGGGDKGARRSSGGKSSIEQHRKPSASPNKRSSVELDEGSGVGGGERGTSADKEGGDEGGNGGSGGKARTGANQGGKKAESVAESNKARSPDKVRTVEVVLTRSPDKVKVVEVALPSRDASAGTAIVTDGSGKGKGKGKQKVAQEEEVEAEEDKEMAEAPTTGRPAKTKAKELLETKAKPKKGRKGR